MYIYIYIYIYIHVCVCKAKAQKTLLFQHLNLGFEAELDELVGCGVPEAEEPDDFELVFDAEDAEPFDDELEPSESEPLCDAESSATSTPALRDATRARLVARGAGADAPNANETRRLLTCSFPSRMLL